MAFAIKAEVSDPRAKTFALTAQKTHQAINKIVGISDEAAAFLNEFF